jgi:hypothetical protein
MFSLNVLLMSCCSWCSKSLNLPHHRNFLLVVEPCGMKAPAVRAMGGRWRSRSGNVLLVATDDVRFGRKGGDLLPQHGLGER